MVTLNLRGKLVKALSPMNMALNWWTFVPSVRGRGSLNRGSMAVKRQGAGIERSVRYQLDQPFHPDSAGLQFGLFGDGIEGVQGEVVVHL